MEIISVIPYSVCTFTIVTPVGFVKNIILYLYPPVCHESLIFLHWFLREFILQNFSEQKVKYSRLPTANSYSSCTFELNLLLHLSSNQRKGTGKGR